MIIGINWFCNVLCFVHKIQTNFLWSKRESYTTRIITGFLQNIVNYILKLFKVRLTSILHTREERFAENNAPQRYLWQNQDIAHSFSDYRLTT